MKGDLEQSKDAELLTGNDLPAVLTVAECIRFLRIGRTVGYALIQSGAIPSIRLGRLIRIPRAALLEWLESHEEVGKK